MASTDKYYHIPICIVIKSSINLQTNFELKGLYSILKFFIW